VNLEDLDGHDGEILDARDMVDAELDPNDDVVVENIILAISPRAHTGAAAGLVGVLPAGVEFTVTVGGDVDVVVGKFGPLVVVGVWVSQHLLEGRSHDLVRDWLAVDGILDFGVLDLEDAVAVRIEIVATCGSHRRLSHYVAYAMGVEVGSRHCMGFVIDETIGEAVDHGVDSEGEYVLVMGC